MNKMLLALSLFVATFSSAFAQEVDYVLPGAKWQAKFTKYICAAFGPEVAAPKEFADLKVKWEDMVTDSTLDNGLIKASFVVEGKTCRYNAIILADNAASTLRLVNSKAYSNEKNVNCADGKALLDAGFEANDYLYYGHPHNLAIMVPMAGAAATCGAGSRFVGVNFINAGRIQK